MKDFWNGFLTRLAIFASMGIGLAITLLFFLMVRSGENKQVASEFDTVAKNAVRAFERELHRNEEVVQSLVAFYLSSEEVEPNEFHLFAATAMNRIQSIHGLGWVSRVKPANQGQSEEACYRVTLIEPEELNTSWLGSNLASAPKERQGLQRACDTGELTAIDGGNPKRGNPELLMLAPLYSNAVVTTVEERRNQLVGFCCGLIQIKKTLEVALDSLGKQRLDFTLFEQTTPGTWRILLRQTVGKNTANPPLPSSPGEPWARPHYSQAVRSAGREWLVLSTPTSEFLKSFSRWRSWNVLAAGLLLTGSVMVSLHRESRRARNLEAHVSRRTRELFNAYHELQAMMRERKEMEEALRVSEERYSLVISGVNDGIWDWNLQTDEVFYSPNWKGMLGYEDQELENRLQTWKDLLHPEDRERAFATVQAYLAGRTPKYELEHRLRHKNGTYRWILARGIALWSDHGRPTRMVGSHVDITDRRLDAERLRQVNADLNQRESQLRSALAKLETAHEELQTTQLQLIQAAKLESVGRLAAGVAHEVKNPLQTMLMGLTFLENSLTQSSADITRPESQKDLREACQDMHDAIDRANAIIRGLLQMSGKPNLQMEPVDINSLLNNALSLVNYNLNANRICTDCHLQPNLPPLRLDYGKIEQVFINLFSNAIQAMPDGGTLSVRTYQRAASPTQTWWREHDSTEEPETVEVVAEVCDTGQGIPEENLDKLFTPFFTTKEKTMGTGLGLSVTKSIIELHGGVIELGNRPEGGAQATLRFKSRKEPTL